ncbi:unnamed protein product [Adineta ricciae]|uniref:Uncharacterized protein n=1 Tax=Adineta ricciae TaxID=249248 RepID=A0A814RUC6_ADIRI|nr:unnamed protein product [Adineta ricciae]CAF1208338.1 unnamed protein product [Adineta ricciae]
MVDFSNYPFPTYIPNRLIAGLFSSFVFLSFIFWCIQSIQTRCQPVRLVILLFVSHVTIFTELMIRATINRTEIQSKLIYIIMTALYTIGQRSIIVANFTCVLQHPIAKFRCCFRIISACIFFSDIFMIPAGLLAVQSNKIHLSFIFRQLSTSMICLILLVFYVVWLWTKTIYNMSFELIVLLIISSLNCLIIALFLLIMSIPKYYIVINDDEEWFYFFQLLPIVLSLIAWSMLHPKRSLFDTANQSDEITVSYSF